MKKPKIKDCYRVERLDGEGLVLLAEDDYAIFTGTIYEEVGPLLTGALDEAAIVETLRGTLQPQEVYYALLQLEAKGYLCDAAQPAPPPMESAYWQLSGVTAGALHDLARCRVSVAESAGLPPGLAARFRERLRARGLAVLDNGGPADLTVVLTSDYLAPEHAAQNAAAIAAGRRWLLVKPVGVSTWTGPLFEPGRTACWSCLAQRLAGHRMIDLFLQRRKRLDRPPMTALAATDSSLAIALDLAAEEVARIAAGAPRTRGKVLSFDHRTHRSAEHHLVRRPQCETCGDGAMKPAVRIDLGACRNTFSAEGGHRSVPPEETVRRFGHHVSPITGIIRELTPLRNDGDAVKHIYGAGHNFAMLVDDMSFLQANLRLGSGGKGKTDMQARASAIGEALERYSGLFQGNEPRRRARMDDLGESAIHPNDCLLFSDRQYDTRDAWNARHDRYQFVPRRFDEEALVDWSPLWSLTHHRERLLPTACCYFGYNHHPIAREDGVAARFAFGDSNGCAAGNTIEEAIFQGLLELLERDSVATWWYSRVQRPAVDLDSFDEPYFAEMQRHYASLGRTLHVLDVTNDLGVPTFVAVSHCTDPERQEIVWGCGTHVEARLGILRALTEANQFLAAFERFQRPQDRYIGFDPAAVRWFSSARIDEQPYLGPLAAPPRTSAHYAAHHASDITREVQLCINRLAAHGHEVLVLDQTREDIGLPVVRVVVPGLRHFFARFAPGRLYDVPERLGWVPRRLPEDELNPVPVFF